MKKRLGVFICLTLVLVLSFSLVSASWFGNFLNKITGKAIDGNCADSDGGVQYYEKGTINEQELITDFCQASSALTCSSPNEDFCVNCYKRGGIVKEGESGCFCQSSGSYINAWFGTCSGSLNYLREYSCLEGERVTETYACPNGCVDGACVQSQPTTKSSCSGNLCTLYEGESVTATLGGDNYVVSIDYIDSLGVVLYINNGTDRGSTDLGMTYRLVEGRTTRMWNIFITIININVQDYQGGIKKVDFEYSSATSQCTDSDGGKNYYVKGNIFGIKENMTSAELFRIKHRGLWLESSDYCATNEGYITDKGNNLVESFCNEKEYIDSETINCPNGCVDGACVNQSQTNQTIPYILAYDIGNFEYVGGESDIEEGNPVYAGTYLYNREVTIHVGIMEFSNRESLLDFMIEAIASSPDCAISGKFKNYYDGNFVYVCDEGYMWTFNNLLFFVKYSDDDDLLDAYLDAYSSDLSSPEAAEIEFSLKPLTCEGCVYDRNKCIPYGIRVDEYYCDIDGEFKLQKGVVGGEWASCDNNYECESNVCSSGECIEVTTIMKQASTFKQAMVNAWCFFIHPFSEDNRNTCKYDLIGS